MSYRRQVSVSSYFYLTKLELNLDMRRKAFTTFFLVQKSNILVSYFFMILKGRFSIFDSLFHELVSFTVSNRLVNETCTIVLVQAGTQTNQIASAIDCAGNIINFTEDHAGKNFFLKIQKRLAL